MFLIREGIMDKGASSKLDRATAAHAVEPVPVSSKAGIPSAWSMMADRLERLVDLCWTDVGPLNDAIHDLAPEPKVIQPPDYIRSYDAVEHFAYSWAAPRTWWNPTAWRWECQLENSLGFPFRYRGMAETEVVARLVAYLRARHAQGTSGSAQDGNRLDPKGAGPVPKGCARPLSPRNP
jgi:hypothetical protein